LNPAVEAISAFFPCYNDEATIASMVRLAVATFERVGVCDAEVIVIDDGSFDNSPKVLAELATEEPLLRVVTHDHNRGYGGALLSGFANATKQWVFYTDGDGQFDFEDIHKLLPLMAQFDIVSGYRIKRSDSLIRKFNGACWTLLIKVFLGLWVRDIDCAFKIYPRKLFDQIEMKSMGALIDAEILARARGLGYTTGQVGVRHYPRMAGEQTGANLRVIARAFKELLTLRRDIRHTGR
jgi:glycosyltransferase involved in cell wall biosynthesis